MLNKADLVEPNKIIQHFRDLYNVSDLIDFDSEIQKTVNLLKEAGWCKEKIQGFQSKASEFTKYESLIPRNIKKQGDMNEYLAHKASHR